MTRSEEHFAQIANIELSLEKARARAERAAQALREDGAEAHLVASLEQVVANLSTTSRELRQGTYFAVPDEQTKIEAA